REAVDAAVADGGRQHVDLALLVFAEGEDGGVRVGDRTVGDDALFGLVVFQAPDLGGNVVAVEIVAVEHRHILTAVDVAAGERLAKDVVVFPDRLDDVLAWADAFEAEGMQAFADAPAVVAPLFDDIDFFVQVLTYVRRPQLAGLAVERHAPDVAQAVRP